MTRASAGIVRKVVTRASAGTAPPVPGNLPRIAQCCCHAAVTNRSSEPLSFVFFNLQALRASVIHVSCLRERWKVEGVFHDKSDNVTCTNRSDWWVCAKLSNHKDKSDLYIGSDPTVTVKYIQWEEEDPLLHISWFFYIPKRRRRWKDRFKNMLQFTTFT